MAVSFVRGSRFADFGRFEEKESRIIDCPPVHRCRFDHEFLTRFPASHRHWRTRAIAPRMGRRRLSPQRNQEFLLRRRLS